MDAKTILKQARKQLRVTQTELGRRYGYTRNQISAYEFGSARVPADIILKLQAIGLALPRSAFLHQLRLETSPDEQVPPQPTNCGGGARDGDALSLLRN